MYLSMAMGVAKTPCVMVTKCCLGSTNVADKMRAAIECCREGNLNLLLNRFPLQCGNPCVCQRSKNATYCLTAFYNINNPTSFQLSFLHDISAVEKFSSLKISALTCQRSFTYPDVARKDLFLIIPAHIQRCIQYLPLPDNRHPNKPFRHPFSSYTLLKNCCTRFHLL